MQFTKKQQTEILKNSKVKALTNTYIYYTKEFKEKVINEYLAEKTASQIFEETGFNVQQTAIDADYASITLGKCGKGYKNNTHNSKKT